MKLHWASLIRPSEKTRVSRAGRVRCPITGDIDLEVCLDCPWLIAASEVAPEVSIVCKPERPITWTESPAGL
jgi:hypothetical protein